MSQSADQARGGADTLPEEAPLSQPFAISDRDRAPLKHATLPIKPTQLRDDGYHRPTTVITRTRFPSSRRLAQPPAELLGFSTSDPRLPTATRPWVRYRHGAKEANLQFNEDIPYLGATPHERAVLGGG